MDTIRGRIKKLAKQHKWFRCCLIGVYVIVYTLRALWRECLCIRKKLTACTAVFALCMFQIFSVIAYAEEAGVSGESKESRAVSAVQESGENADFSKADSGEPSSQGASGASGGNQGSSAGTGAEGGAAGKDGAADGAVKDEAANGAVKDGAVDGTVKDGAVNETAPKDGAADENAGKDKVVDETTPKDVPVKDLANEQEQPKEKDEISGNDLPAEEAPKEEAPQEEIPEEELPEEPIEEEKQVQYIPKLSIEYNMADEISGMLIGNTESVITLSTGSSYMEPTEGEEFGASPAAGAYYAYGVYSEENEEGVESEANKINEANGEMLFVDLSGGEADVILPDAFYGSIAFTAVDAEGNIYEESTPILFIDASAPTIDIAEQELSDGSKQMSAVFRESGDTATGIAKIRCFINEKEVPADDYAITGVLENQFGQAVASEAEFPLPLQQSGVYTVRLEVEDYVGNQSSCIREILVPEKLGPICVSAPAEIGLKIAPWTVDEEQVSSTEFTMENKSGYDIVATLEKAKMTVNRDNVKTGAKEKNCELILSGDVLEDISLPEGDSEKLFRILIPAKKEDGVTNGSITMRVHGNLSKDSELLWRDGDVKVTLSFQYEAAKKEEK